ncbi:MerR family transcriptional regulator [bacterium]|nr:MerR family transcriptional regulator [bacterium]
MSDDEFNRPRYPISVVANLLDVHQQTLRLYEREGLVKPQRTPRNTRMYSESDVEQLRSILSLTDIGVNLAGVEIIMQMRDHIEMERSKFRAILAEIWERYKIDPEHWVDIESTDLIPISNRKVMKVRREKPKKQSVETIESEDE